MKMSLTCVHYEVGDEFHYLFNCIKLKYERQNCIPNYYHVRPDTHEYYEMFNTTNQK